jgi:hypothetical protein
MVGQNPGDRRRRDPRMFLLQVPDQGVRAGVQAPLRKALTQLQDALDHPRVRRGRSGVWSAGPRLERGLALGLVPRDEPADPRLGDPVLPGNLALRAALDDDRSDHQACLRHAARRSPWPCGCLETRHAYVLKPDTAGTLLPGHYCRGTTNPQVTASLCGLMGLDLDNLSAGCPQSSPSSGGPRRGSAMSRAGR